MMMSLYYTKNHNPQNLSSWSGRIYPLFCPENLFYFDFPASVSFISRPARYLSRISIQYLSPSGLFLNISCIQGGLLPLKYFNFPFSRKEILLLLPNWKRPAYYFISNSLRCILPPKYEVYCLACFTTRGLLNLSLPLISHPKSNMTL